MLTIYGAGSLATFAGQVYSIKQASEGTIVRNVLTGSIVTLPKGRYSLAHNAPASGKPGRAAFTQDFLAAIGANQ